MAKDEIKLSPKHGLNPSMPICFFCGEEKGEIALLGRINKADDEAPKHILLDYEPCDRCKSAMSQGITIIGVVEKPLSERQVPIAEGLYPTGSWAVITEECAKRAFKEEVLPHILEKKVCFTDDALVKQIIDQSGDL